MWDYRENLKENNVELWIFLGNKNYWLHKCLMFKIDQKKYMNHLRGHSHFLWEGTARLRRKLNEKFTLNALITRKNKSDPMRFELSFFEIRIKIDTSFRFLDRMYRLQYEIDKQNGMSEEEAALMKWKQLLRNHLSLFDTWCWLSMTYNRVRATHWNLRLIFTRKSIQWLIQFVPLIETDAIS